MQYICPMHPWYRDVHSIQELFQSHALAASKLYPKSLWRVLNSVARESRVTQTHVLKACRTLLPSSERKLWPQSRRQVDRLIAKRLGSFFPRVLRTIDVDLTHHNLPTIRETITFTYIDPVFAWANCAYELSKAHKLHFEYKPLYCPDSGELLYGSSVQNGQIMRQACLSRTGAPALFGVSLDSGQASRRRSYTPILVTVGNCDCVNRVSCACVGYLPDLGIDATTPAGKAAMHEIRQACVGAIMTAIEQCGQHGFKCMLRSGENTK